jgi:hypothetical protein
MDDLLLTITGANVGKTARVTVDVDEAYVSQHVALIRMIEARVAEYLHLFLTASAGGRGQLDKAAYGAGKPGLNLQQVAEVAVPLPSMREIRALMEKLLTHFYSTRSQEVAITTSLTNPPPNARTSSAPPSPASWFPKTPTTNPPACCSNAFAASGPPRKLQSPFIKEAKKEDDDQLCGLCG